MGLPKEMERHFPIKPRQPIGIVLVTILSFPNSLIRAKNRFVKNGTANFDRNIPTEISGPPPEAILSIPVGRNRNGPFHLNSDRNFRNLWHNESTLYDTPFLMVKCTSGDLHLKNVRLLHPSLKFRQNFNPFSFCW